MYSLFNKYGDLIRSLPIEEHSFTSKTENWKNLTANITKYHENIFSFDSTITISRKELFDSFKDDPIEKFILKVLYWAYPRGLRGNNFVEIIEPGNFELLKDFLEDIKADNTINEKRIKHALKNIKGINFSTLSKYLYFTRSNFDGKHCLIIDKRLISVFNKMYFVEYNSLRKISYPCTVSQYLDYIDISHRIACENKFSADQLEMFLFIFGNNLKLEPVGDNGWWDESWDYEDNNQYETRN